MKIIYLHQYFKKPTENGGTRSYDLATAFVKQGHQVEVVTTTSEKEDFNAGRWRVEMVDNVKVNYLYLPYDNSYSVLKRITVFVLFLWHSFYKLRKIQADVVLATSTPLTIGIPALLKKWIDGTPYIFEVRDVWPEAVIAIGVVRNAFIKKLLYKLESMLYSNAEFVVPLSIDMQRSIQTRYPKLLGKTQTVVENISEIDRFRMASNRSDYLEKTIGFTPKTSILYAGTFGKVNKIEYVIELAAELYKIDPSIVFLLMGSGAEKQNLIELAMDLKVFKKNVFFLEPVGKKDLPEIYNCVSMGSSFVAPIKELWANSANKFFDTLAAGKPILINHGGWQSNVITENNIGYVLKPQVKDNNLVDFVSFVNNSENLLATGERARDFATENYSLPVAVQKYRKLFELLYFKKKKQSNVS